MAAFIGTDGYGILAVDPYAIAPAGSKAPLFLRESMNEDGRGRGREGLFQEHIKGAGEGDKAQLFLKLAAVALTGEEISRLSQASYDFSLHPTTFLLLKNLPQQIKVSVYY